MRSFVGSFGYMTVLQFLQTTWWDSLWVVVILIVAFSVCLLMVKDLIWPTRRSPKLHKQPSPNHVDKPREEAYP